MRPFLFESLRNSQLAKWLVSSMILMFCSPTSGLKNGLNGAYFRISAHHFPPYQLLDLKPNGTFVYSGSTPNVIYWIAEKFNMTFDFFPVDSNQISEIGSVEAGLNQLINKEVEISTLCIVPTLERSEYMEFSYPVAIESYRFLVPKPQEESRLWGPIRPFQPLVWVFVFLSVLIPVLLFTYFAWCYSLWNFTPLRNQRRRDIFSIFFFHAFYASSVFTNHGAFITIKRDSFRILAGLWLLAATVLVNSYSGTLMSSLTILKFKPTINSLEDLAANDELIMTGDAKSVIMNTVLNGTTPALKAIGNAMRRNPESLYLTREQGLANIFSLKYAFPTVESYATYLIAQDLEKTGECRFHVTDRIPITQAYTFGLAKDNKFNQLLSEKIQYLWETGLMKHWLKNNLPHTDKCLNLNKESARQKPIKLVDLTSAFFILGTGTGLAIICFILECIYFKYQRRKKRNEYLLVRELIVE